MSSRDSLSAPDWAAPLDAEAHLRAMPDSATVKGMFFDDVLTEVRRRGAALPARGPYFQFKNYPMREFMQVTLDASRVLHPRATPREGLRRLGHLGERKHHRPERRGHATTALTLTVSS